MIREASGQDGAASYWWIGKQGYLSERLYGYALAVFAHARGEGAPAWAGHLRLNVRDVFTRGLDYLQKTSDTQFRPVDEGDRELPPAERLARAVAALGSPSSGARLAALWALKEMKLEVAPAVPGPASVRALGAMMKLLRARKAATYEGQTAGAIVRDLISTAGADAGTVGDGPTLPRFAIDQRVSAYAHARGLANRLGYELYAKHDGKIQFHGLGAAANLDAGGLGGLGGGLASAAGGALASAAGALTGAGGTGYAYAKHLVAAAAQHAVAAAGTVKIGGESPMSTKGDSTSYWLNASETAPDGSAGSGDPALLYIDPAARTTDLAARFASGFLVLRNRTANAVTIDVLGRPSVDLGDSISVSDLPGESGALSGYVRAIRHTFGARRGFVSRLRVALEPAS